MVLDTMPRRQNGSALALMRKDPPYLKMSSRGIKHKKRFLIKSALRKLRGIHSFSHAYDKASIISAMLCKVVLSKVGHLAHVH
jgi:hypothetical protein